MKSNSNIRPASLLDLGDGNWHYNWNITEGVREDEQGNETPDFNYDTAFIAGEPTVPKSWPPWSTKPTPTKTYP